MIEDKRPKIALLYYNENLKVIDMDGNTLKEGSDYEIKDDCLLPLHSITIKEIRYDKQPQRPNRAQRRHPNR